MAAGDEQFVQNVKASEADRMLTRLEAAANRSGKARHYETRAAGEDKNGNELLAIYLIWDE